MWVHLEDTSPVARKRYVCVLCEKEIPKGEEHIKRAGVSEEGIGSFRMHTECERFTHDKDFDWEWNDPFEFRRNYLGEK